MTQVSTSKKIPLLENASLGRAFSAVFFKALSIYESANSRNAVPARRSAEDSTLVRRGATTPLGRHFADEINRAMRSQQGAPPKTVREYGKEKQRRWGCISQPYQINRAMRSQQGVAPKTVL